MAALAKSANTWPGRWKALEWHVVRCEKLGPFLRRWLDEVARPTIRESTYASYDDIVAGHLIPGLGRIGLAKLGPADVQASSTQGRGRPVTTPGPVHPRGLTPGPGHGRALGDGDPQRREAGRRPARAAP